MLSSPLSGKSITRRRGPRRDSGPTGIALSILADSSTATIEPATVKPLTLSSAPTVDVTVADAGPVASSAAPPATPVKKAATPVKKIVSSTMTRELTAPSPASSPAPSPASPAVPPEPPTEPLAVPEADGDAAPKRRHAHWLGLDGLRAFAVISVVAYHFDPTGLTGGFLGVDVFFVISGYLITRLLTGEYLDSGRINRPAFYLRRARRLLPALATVLAAISVAALIWRDQLATVRPGVLATAFFGGNWWLAFDHVPYFASSGRPSMLQHLWSLGVEEQFYLVWPLICVAVLSWRGGSIRRLGWVAFGLALASTGLMWLLADIHNVPYGANTINTLYYGTDTHSMGLLLGAALGCLSVTGWFDQLGRRLPGWLWKFGGDVVGLGALVALIAIMANVEYYSWIPLFRWGFLLVAFLVCVVIWAATREGSWLGASLDQPVLRWIGVRSYSIYLWHWPVAVVTRPGIDTHMPILLDQAIRITVTLLLSDVTYRFIEQPIRKRGFRATLHSVRNLVAARWRNRPPSLPVVAIGSWVALVVVGVGVLAVGPSAPIPAAARSIGGPGGKNLPIGPSKPAHHHRPSGTSKPGHGTTPHHHGSGPGSPHHQAPPPKPKLPKISGFGDSVLLGARVTLGTIFPGGHIDAIEGRQPGPILADADADAKAGTLNPLVILDLGNNGTLDPADLERTLTDLKNVPVVLVFTLHIGQFDHPWQDPNNAAIERIVPKFPNAHIVRWNQIAGNHPHWLYSDQIHLTPQGAIGYAELVKKSYLAAIGH